MTRSSCADPGSRARHSEPRPRHGPSARFAPVLGAILLGAVRVLAAAERDFVWNTELREIYTQNVQRAGEGGDDDRITSFTATAEMQVRTPRSESVFGYSPELLQYREFDEFDHLDHHEYARWLVRPGVRSEFQFRQGFSLSTRQVGFSDLAGAGGGVGQPVTARSERTVWDAEPRWTFHPVLLHTFTLGALYRSESYSGEDVATGAGFVDSEQFGMQAQYDLPVGRSQTIGGKIKGDRYRFSEDSTAIDNDAYDQFFNLGVSWSLRHPGRFELAGSAGAYRASGEGVEDVFKPTADLAGTWLWIRKALRLGYVLGYSSGGGLTTSEQSQSVTLNYNFTSPGGWTFGASGSTIRRRPLNDDLTSEDSLYGYQADASFGRQWRTGIGLTATASYLHQQQQESASEVDMDDLGFMEGSIGVRYRPPAPGPRAPRP